jgi:ribonuclease BN (tRNA processing enzyme)
MEITILGSGGFAPEGTGDAVRNPSGYAVRMPGGGIAIMDLGFGNVRKLAQCAVPLQDITHVFITHFHPDHWGDLPALLFHFRYAQKPRGGKLTVAGPAGMKKLVDDIHSTFRGGTMPQGYELAVEELLPGNDFKSDTFLLRTAKTEHTRESLAFRLESGGKVLAYTGDASEPGTLAEFFTDTDILIADAALPDGAPRPRAHMTPSEVAGLAAACKAKKTIFSHLSVDSARQAREKSGQNPVFTEARDGLIVAF